MGAICPIFNIPPQALLEIIRAYDFKSLQKVFKVAGSPKKAMDFIRTMITSPEDILNEWFDTEVVKPHAFLQQSHWRQTIVEQ